MCITWTAAILSQLYNENICPLLPSSVRLFEEILVFLFPFHTFRKRTLEAKGNQSFSRFISKRTLSATTCAESLCLTTKAQNQRPSLATAVVVVDDVHHTQPYTNPSLCNIKVKPLWYPRKSITGSEVTANKLLAILMQESNIAPPRFVCIWILAFVHEP